MQGSTSDDIKVGEITVDSCPLNVVLVEVTLDVSIIEVGTNPLIPREGRVMASAGLMTKIVINNQYGPGDIVPGSKKINVALEVYRPAWTR